jgi:hypothetical protein
VYKATGIPFLKKVLFGPSRAEKRRAREQIEEEKAEEKRQADVEEAERQAVFAKQELGGPPVWMLESVYNRERHEKEHNQKQLELPDISHRVDYERPVCPRGQERVAQFKEHHTSRRGENGRLGDYLWGELDMKQRKARGLGLDVHTLAERRDAKKARARRRAQKIIDAEKAEEDAKKAEAAAAAAAAKKERRQARRAKRALEKRAALSAALDGGANAGGEGGGGDWNDNEGEGYDGASSYYTGDGGSTYMGNEEEVRMRSRSVRTGGDACSHSVASTCSRRQGGGGGSGRSGRRGGRGRRGSGGGRSRAGGGSVRGSGGTIMETGEGGGGDGGDSSSDDSSSAHVSLASLLPDIHRPGTPMRAFKAEGRKAKKERRRRLFQFGTGLLGHAAKQGLLEPGSDGVACKSSMENTRRTFGRSS